MRCVCGEESVLHISFGQENSAGRYDTDLLIEGGEQV